MRALEDAAADGAPLVILRLDTPRGLSASMRDMVQAILAAPMPVAGWAYGAIYSSSRERAAALDGWLWTYNHRRPHGALSHKPPITRLNELNNVPGSYT